MFVFLNQHTRTPNPDQTRTEPEPGTDPGSDTGTDIDPRHRQRRRHRLWHRPPTRTRHRLPALTPNPNPAPTAGTGTAPCPLMLRFPLSPLPAPGAPPASAHDPDTAARSAGPAPGLTLFPHQSRWARGRGLSWSSTRAPREPPGPSGTALSEVHAVPRAGAPHGGLYPPPKGVLSGEASPLHRHQAALLTADTHLWPCFDSSPIKPLLQLTLTQPAPV